MNKTLIVNISGIIFHIEEDAYETLKVYLTEVNKHFGLSAESLEIVADIESRVAEILSGILKRLSTQVVTDKDVEEVIAQMGRPADFDAEATEEEGKSKPLIGETADLEKTRRLFRDGDDKVLGGVCGGLAHYFNIDPVWIRVAWAILFFAYGIGLLPYIVFWIAMPKAKTRAEKLAMKGEKINLKTIQDSASDELNKIKQNVAHYGDKLQKMGFFAHAGHLLRSLFSTLVDIFLALFRVLVGFIGICLILAGLGAAISCLSLPFFSLADTARMSDWPISTLGNAQYGSIALICLVVLMFIPSFLFIFLGIRLLIRKNVLKLTFILSMGAIWFLCLFTMIFLVWQSSLDFTENVTIKKETRIQVSSTKHYYLQTDGNPDLTSSMSIGSGEHCLHLNWYRSGAFHFKNFPISFRIEKSDSSKSFLTEEFTAYGATKNRALKRAQQLSYGFIQHDSTLIFPTLLEFNNETGFHGQQVHLSLKIPVNTEITIDSRLDILDLPDIQDYIFGEKPKNVWIMTEQGLVPKFGKKIGRDIE